MDMMELGNHVMKMLDYVKEDMTEYPESEIQDAVVVVVFNTPCPGPPDCEYDECQGHPITRFRSTNSSLFWQKGLFSLLEEEM